MDLRELIAAALKEDIKSGDITTKLTVPDDLLGTAKVISNSTGIIAGIEAFVEVYRQVDESLQVQTGCGDGDSIATGDEVIFLSGAYASILVGERTALNFLGQLSGIATLTARFVKRVEGTGSVILDTRKTIPLMRKLQKDAVRAGGGANHRFGLYDMVLVKDNHEAAAGSIDKALTRIDTNLKPGILIEVEVQSLAQLDEVLEHRVDRVLLDNFDLETIHKAVKKVSGRIPLEVSGGITLENVRDIALTGVEFISVGALTHSAPNLDFSLRIDEK